VTTNLEQQLVQLDELLGLLDAKALRGAQEALEHQIAELSEQLETTRQSLAQAHAQRKRLARARLLLDDSVSDTNGNGDPALHHIAVTEAVLEEPIAAPEEPIAAPEEPKAVKAATTAPFVAERRSSGAAAERRLVEDRRSKG
jgi:chromosome segregation ATPase